MKRLALILASVILLFASCSNETDNDSGGQNPGQTGSGGSQQTEDGSDTGDSGDTDTSSGFANDDNYAADTTGLPNWYGNLRLGWNLGNALDAHNDGVSGETAWGNPTITQVLLTKVKEAGFDIVRIPVTWLGHIGDASSHYAIESSYMSRVKEVVGYAKTAGLKVIVNIHHDGGDSEYWLNIKNACGYVSKDSSKPDSSEAVAARERIGEQLYYMWRQIAAAFPNSEDYIIFETMNEIHDGGWGWGENRKSGTAQYEILNEWNQICVRAIRYAGAKNYIGVQGYVCNPDLTREHLKLPTDKLNKLLVSVHDYQPTNFSLEDEVHEWGKTGTNVSDHGQESAIKESFENLKQTFGSKGTSVYLGETGCIYHGAEKDQYRIAYNTYVIKAALANGIVPIIWDNGVKGEGAEHSGLFDRTTGEVNDYCKNLVAAMVAASKSVDYNGGNID